MYNLPVKASKWSNFRFSTISVNFDKLVTFGTGIYWHNIFIDLQGKASMLSNYAIFQVNRAIEQKLTSPRLARIFKKYSFSMNISEIDIWLIFKDKHNCVEKCTIC